MFITEEVEEVKNNERILESKCAHSLVPQSRISSGPNILGDLVIAQIKEVVCEKCPLVYEFRIVKFDSKYDV